jgi:ubiquinol-cytochrome c reductase cytochrome c subunit
MPLADPTDAPHRKPRAYSDTEITDLVAYVSSLGAGPALPSVDPAKGDLAAGGELFRADCAPCHSAAGVGGALSYGHAAPNIHPANNEEIAAAVRSGPGQMPVFPQDVISDDDLDSLVRYAQYLDKPDDRGGLPLGRVGPIPEGFVTWVIGVGALLLGVGWIGTRMKRAG